MQETPGMEALNCSKESPADFSEMSCDCLKAKSQNSLFNALLSILKLANLDLQLHIPFIGGNSNQSKAKHIQPHIYEEKWRMGHNCLDDDLLRDSISKKKALQIAANSKNESS